jgi:hypothetical protein
VPLDKWREELRRRGVLAKDLRNPRDAFIRTKDTLIACSLMAERDGLVWAA